MDQGQDLEIELLQGSLNSLSIGVVPADIVKRVDIMHCLSLLPPVFSDQQERLRQAIFSEYVTERYSAGHAAEIVDVLMQSNELSFQNIAMKTLEAKGKQPKSITFGYLSSYGFIPPDFTGKLTDEIYDNVQEAVHLLTAGLCTEEMVRHDWIIRQMTETYIPHLYYRDRWNLQGEGRINVLLELEDSPLVKEKAADGSDVYIRKAIIEETNKRTKQATKTEVITEIYTPLPKRLEYLRIPDSEKGDPKLPEAPSDLDVYVITEESDYVVKYKRKNTPFKKRISGLCAWKFYDQHPIFGKHVYMEILCSREEYIPNPSGPWIVDPPKDVVDDAFKNSVRMEEIDPPEYPLLSSLMFGARPGEKQIEKIEIKGLAALGRWRMYLDAYRKGYRRLVLEVIVTNDEGSQSPSTIRRYIEMGFVIVSTKVEPLGESTYYFLMRTIKKADIRDIIQKCLSNSDWGELSKKLDGMTVKKQE